MAVDKIEFTMRLDAMSHAKIKKIAAMEKRSMTNLIVYTIQQEIIRYEKQNGEIPIYQEDTALE